MRYVGIKNCPQKATLIKHALKRGKKVTLQLPSVTADDCERHFEVLRLLDRDASDSEMRETMYYQFNKANGKKDRDILKKIKRFRDLYLVIKGKGYNYKKGYIILSEDGARLDGSHRAAIVEHLQYPEIIVLMVKWSDCFKPKQVKGVLKHLASQKKKYNAV